MAAVEETTEISATETAGAAAGGSKLMLTLTVVNIIATLAMILVLFVSFQRDKRNSGIEDLAIQESAISNSEIKGGEAKSADGKPVLKLKSSLYGKMVTLERFTVNLSTPGSSNPRFVQVNVSLEVSADDVEHELNAKMPQVRNVIIDLFNSKRASDLATGEGRDYIKEEIRNALNGFMVSGKVKGVYFTNFNLSS